MDHFVHPQDAEFLPVTVPYYDKYRYHGGSFTDYPIRCGFNKRKFEIANFGDLKSDDHNSFFQAWLFFGLIQEGFGANVADGAKCTDEFIDHHEQIVVMARLWDWAAKWKRSLSSLSQSSKIAECERVTDCLHESERMISFLDDRKNRREGRSHLSEEVAMSIIVLGCALQEVIADVESPIPRDQFRVHVEMVKFPGSEFAQKRLEAAGWCKAEVSRFEEYMGPIGMLYCASLLSSGSTLDHSRCSEDRCAAADIDEETYKTAHVDGCEGCNDRSPEIGVLEKVVSGGSIPVIELTKSEATSDINISVVSAKAKPYTAISHVWADGLGNQGGNSLPRCQMLRLYDWVLSENRTREERKRRLQPAFYEGIPMPSTVYLWIDTLCIPRNNKMLRKKAISSMYDVYKMAKSVLVLDRSLWSISTKIPPEELCCRIVAMSWMRRGWTLQEGRLANSLSVQFADGAIDAFAEINGKLLLRRAEGGLLRRMMLKNVSCALTRDVLYFGRREHSDQVNVVLNALTYRSTTRPEDREICFAIILRCNMHRIMDVEGAFRTKEIYRQLQYIPRNFLFHSRPTLDIPGFRWAPKDIFSVPGTVPGSALDVSNGGLLVVGVGMVYFGLSQHVTGESLVIRDITGKWYKLRMCFDGSKAKSAATRTILAVIPNEPYFSGPVTTSVVIRLDWDSSIANPQGLSNYVTHCDTISGEYIGLAGLVERKQSEPNLMEERWLANEKKRAEIAEAIAKGEKRLEDYSQRVRQIVEEGFPYTFFQGEMLKSEQKWCVT